MLQGKGCPFFLHILTLKQGDFWMSCWGLRGRSVLVYPSDLLQVSSLLINRYRTSLFHKFFQHLHFYWPLFSKWSDPYWQMGSGSCYDVERSGWLTSFFLCVFFFLLLQGLHMQHRMQGEASRRSGDVTSTMMLTPTRMPTTWVKTEISCDNVFNQNFVLLHGWTRVPQTARYTPVGELLHSNL